MPASDYEILLIDDGSTDKSGLLCDEYEKQYAQIKVIHQENLGVSRARNTGIRNARGRYITYVDSDDFISKETLEKVADFFDEHYESVDLVAFPSTILVQGKAAPPHYRYRTLTHEGIYDLNDISNIYAHITRLEVFVKNIGNANILFDTRLGFQEDLKYNTDIILNSMRIGFCDAGRYYYEQQDGGIQRSIFSAMNIFETSTSLWEQEFARYQTTPPKYLQALFLNDTSWKLNTDALIPYHYPTNKFEAAMERLGALLSKIERDVIMLHPKLSLEDKLLFVDKCKSGPLKCYANNDSIELADSEGVLLSDSNVTVSLLRVKKDGKKLTVRGVLHSPILNYCEKPRLEVRVESKDNKYIQQVDVSDSSWGYKHRKTKTDTIWCFTLDVPLSLPTRLTFKVRILGLETVPTMDFGSVFAQILDVSERQSFARNGISINLNSNNVTFAIAHRKKQLQLIWNKNLVFFALDKKVRIIRTVASLKSQQKTKTWLYVNCSDHAESNVFLQFVHDSTMKDGIRRFYSAPKRPASAVLASCNIKQNRILSFKSDKHRYCTLAADRIITSSSDPDQFLPFSRKGLENYSDLFGFDVFYLPDDAMQSHEPWTRSADRALLDGIIVSSNLEEKNLSSQYGYKEDGIMKLGSPKHDLLQIDLAPDNRILFALAARARFCPNKEADPGSWNPSVTNAFKKTRYYNQTIAFLKNPQLASMLKHWGYHIDVLIDPSLQNAPRDLFDMNDSRIRTITEPLDIPNYKILITDCAPYRFDFAYLGRAIVYYFPDFDEFRSGMYRYRSFDIPLHNLFGNLAVKPDEALAELERLIINDGLPDKRHLRQMKDFFIFKDTDNRRRIYTALINKKNTVIV